MTGESAKCSISKTSSGGSFISGIFTGTGSMLKASAFPCNRVPQNFSVNSYEDKNRNHRRTQADARGDNALHSLNSTRRGLWSVTSSKHVQAGRDETFSHQPHANPPSPTVSSCAQPWTVFVRCMLSACQIHQAVVLVFCNCLFLLKWAKW